MSTRLYKSETCVRSACPFSLISRISSVALQKQAAARGASPIRTTCRWPCHAHSLSAGKRTISPFFAPQISESASFSHGIMIPPAANALRHSSHASACKNSSALTSASKYHAVPSLLITILSADCENGNIVLTRSMVLSAKIFSSRRALFVQL